MNYYNFLNESFDKMLLEAKQDEINFKNAFNDDLLARFKAQKQRMHSPENDFYYWIRKARENKEATMDELEDFLSGLEGKMTRSQMRQFAQDGADVLYDDDEWIVLKINTYEAAKKYGAGSVWCITGRYPGHEGRGRDFFNQYKEDNGWDYYFYIKKDGADLAGRQEKWCLCWDGEGDDYQIWRGDQREQSEGTVQYIPNAPQVPGLPDVSVELEEPEYDEYDDEDGEQGEPAPRGPAPFEIVNIEDGNEMEFPANSKEEAAEAFKPGSEIVGQLLEPNLWILKWHEEPEMDVEVDDQGELQDVAQDNGDRFCAFVYMPGQGGGPLLMQTNNGFGLQVFKSEDVLRQTFAPIFGGNFEIQNNRDMGEDLDLPECLRENFFYYDDGSWYYDID